jgi:hypothetical protein
VEAAVEGLRLLEPGTAGLNRLIHCFNHMVETQLAHPAADYGDLPFHLRHRPKPNIPLELRGNLENVVVACGESILRRSNAAAVHEQQPGEQFPGQQFPVFWAAKRLADGTTFSVPIQSGPSLTEQKLEHMQLPRKRWDSALSVSEFRHRWNQFLGTRDCLVVFNQGSIDLLQSVDARVPIHFLVKSIHVPALDSPQWIDGDLPVGVADQIEVQLPGRVGIRLARLVAVVRYLNRLEIGHC